MLALLLDLNHIRIEIDKYKYLHERYQPIILMNNDTVEYLKKIALEKINFNPEDVKDLTLCGCHIAIANWLPFGEVELK